MTIKRLIKEYFSYSTSEKRGLVILLVLLILVYLLPRFITMQDQGEEVFDSKKQKQIDSLLVVIENRNKKVKSNSARYYLTDFDPNTASKLKLCSLGFNRFQANNIIKYRDKGGQFRDKNDLAKIYGITEKDIDRVGAYIRIPISELGNANVVTKKESTAYLFYFDPNNISPAEWDSLGVDSKISFRIRKYLATGARFKSPSDLGKIYGFDSLKLKMLLPYIKISKPEMGDKREKLLVDLNHSDTTELKKLPGIGSVLSNRIVKYRNLLGGFVRKEQLQEVYGISKKQYNRMSSMIIVNSPSVRRIRLNTEFADSLKCHPYIGFRLTQDIIRYRQRNGQFNSLNQLVQSHLVSDSLLNKLKPYLSLD